MRKTRQELGIRTALTRMIRLEDTLFNDWVRRGSLLKSIPSSNFGETTAFTPSAHVLHAASSTPWQNTRLLLKAQRRSLPNFTRPRKMYQLSDLQTSTTRTQS